MVNTVVLTIVAIVAGVISLVLTCLISLFLGGWGGDCWWIFAICFTVAVTILTLRSSREWIETYATQSLIHVPEEG